MDLASAINVTGGGAIPAGLSPSAAPQTQATPQLSAPGRAGALLPGGPAAAGSTWASGETASLTQLSINQSSETLMVSSAQQGAVTNNDLLGAVLLMLLLEYMQSQDKQDKNALGLMMGLIMQMQQQDSSRQSMLLYGSHSLSVESTQIQMVSSQEASNAYTNAGVDPAASGTSGASINVVA